jgi:hypothetical protein
MLCSARQFQYTEQNKKYQIFSYHSSHMFKQKDQKRRRMLSPDWLAGDQVSVKLWIELHNASVKLNINWNSQAVTAQQNLVQCPSILNAELHYSKINKLTALGFRISAGRVNVWTVSPTGELKDGKKL